MNKKDPQRLDIVSSKASYSSFEGFKRFWPFLKPVFFWLVLGVILTIPVGGLDAAVASFLKPFMDNVMVEKDSEFAKQVPYIIVAFTIVQGICIYVSNLVNTYVGNRIATNLKKDLYKKLLLADISFFDKNTSGIVINRFASDADTATSGLVSNTKLFLSKFWSSLGLVGVLLYNSWQLSLIAVGVLIFLFIPISIVRKKVSKSIAKSVRYGTQLSSRYIETYSGIRIIKSFNLQKILFDKFNVNVEELFKISMKMTRDTNWLGPVMHVVTAVGVAGVLYYGLHLITSGVITSGTFVAFIAALIMLYTPIKSIGNNYVGLQTSMLALERIYTVLDLYSVEETEKQDRKSLKGIKSSICFEHVDFSYDGHRKVLKDISFEVPVGSKVALVGNSGGGKSTITALIPRLYELDSGKVLIDGTDIKEYSISSLRDNISMVFQDNFLFDGTIRENLMYGNDNATEEQIEIAIKSAFLDDFVKKLPNGLDTVIGERGLLLSGGQKQRLAIARAILKNSPVVILDEATSALDNKSEKIVQRALDKLMEGRTTIVIAHRLSTIMDADKILVINDGKLVESGNHAELLEKHGAYSVLYNSQFAFKNGQTEQPDN
ncbi:ATP-binding cassette, subfamily B, MsbA [Succinivibrio dextrinosolvens]|uniref:ABC transporter ATP-binding protein n=1 Tax=Succinivibrio dextrinosolvens TaxID=83771 RepID=UPI0008EAD187|nr:ABC transporter ATP-binding protein [Succinivibrio dextrinosolvens]SFS85821.1 ATP-binding cassette, subfamily B, MsbA [Succinivibrio dextrinosolvens]